MDLILTVVGILLVGYTSNTVNFYTAVSYLNLIHTPWKVVDRHAEKTFVLTSYALVFSKSCPLSLLMAKRNFSPWQRSRMCMAICFVSFLYLKYHKALLPIVSHLKTFASYML